MLLRILGVTLGARRGAVARDYGLARVVAATAQIRPKCYRGNDSCCDRALSADVAERARAHGKEAPRLFAWLLRENRFDYITQADEDRALARIKAGVRAAANRHREAAQEKQQGGREDNIHVGNGPGRATTEAMTRSWPGSGRPNGSCMLHRDRQAERTGPVRIALMAGWTRQKWEIARESYDLADRQRWTQAAKEVGSLFLQQSERC